MTLKRRGFLKGLGTSIASLVAAPLLNNNKEAIAAEAERIAAGRTKAGTEQPPKYLDAAYEPSSHPVESIQLLDNDIISEKTLKMHCSCRCIPHSFLPPLCGTGVIPQPPRGPTGIVPCSGVSYEY